MPGRHLWLSSKRMANSIFNIARTKATRRHARTVDATEIAARYFVYRLYEATWRISDAVGGVVRDRRVSGDHLPSG